MLPLPLCFYDWLYWLYKDLPPTPSIALKYQVLYLFNSIRGTQILCGKSRRMLYVLHSPQSSRQTPRTYANLYLQNKYASSRILLLHHPFLVSHFVTCMAQLRTFLIRNGLSILFKEGPSAYKAYYLRWRFPVILVENQ